MAVSKTEESLANRLKLFYEEGFLSDVTITVESPKETKEFKAHQLILALRSRVFMTMFLEMPRVECEIKVQNICPDGFKTFLRYLYTNDANFENIQAAVEVCKISKKYLVSCLEFKCNEYIWKNIEVSSNDACKQFEDAVLPGEELKIFKCLRIFETETEDILKSESFLKANLKTVEFIAKKTKLNLSSEFLLFQAIYKWAQHQCKIQHIEPNKSNLMYLLCDVLPYIRFFTMTTEETTQILALNFIEQEEITQILSRRNITDKTDNSAYEIQDKRNSILDDKLVLFVENRALKIAKDRKHTPVEAYFGTGYENFSLQLTMQEGSFFVHKISISTWHMDTVPVECTFKKASSDLELDKTLPTQKVLLRSDIPNSTHNMLCSELIPIFLKQGDILEVELINVITGSEKLQSYENHADIEIGDNCILVQTKNQHSFPFEYLTIHYCPYK